MIKVETWRKAWSILERRERRNALLVLCVVIIGSFSALLMVASVLPFLSVISDPEIIVRNKWLHRAYVTFGFTSTYSFLVALGVASLAAIVTGNVSQMAKVYVLERFSEMRVHSLSQGLLSAFLRQPYEFFLDHNTGEMANGVLDESREVVSQFFRPAAELIASSLTVLSLLALLVWVSPTIAAISFGIFGTSYGILLFFSRKIMAHLGRMRLDANRKRFRYSKEALVGIKDIKISGHESHYLNRYKVPSHTVARSRIASNLVAMLPYYALQVLAFGGIIGLCLVLLDTDQVDTGSAVGGVLPIIGVFALAGQRLMPELQRVFRSISALRFSTAAVESYHQYMMLKTDSRPLPTTTPKALGLQRELSFDRVVYRYPSADTATLEDLSLTISKGERIGIVGTTGAGKTTLVDLLLGLLRPQSGCLVVDGTKVTDDLVRSWQQTVGYVPQNIFLTDASVGENIAFGLDPGDIDQTRLEKSARIAQVHDFVSAELPHGYATDIGENGVRLSGGQRQRIGIARALYHDSDLIVFDEATSALDNLTERDLIDAIQALPGDKTLVVVAHRLSTVKICDRILVLDNGKIVAEGNWESILAKNEMFRRLVDAS